MEFVDFFNDFSFINVPYFSAFGQNGSYAIRRSYEHERGQTFQLVPAQRSHRSGLRCRSSHLGWSSQADDLQTDAFALRRFQYIRGEQCSWNFKAKQSKMIVFKNISGIFKGMTCHGLPRLTMSRGRVVFENGQVTAPKGSGKFVETAPFSPYVYSLIQQRDQVWTYPWFYTQCFLILLLFNLISQSFVSSSFEWASQWHKGKPNKLEHAYRLWMHLHINIVIAFFRSVHRFAFNAMVRPPRTALFLFVSRWWRRIRFKMNSIHGLLLVPAVEIWWIRRLPSVVGVELRNFEFFYWSKFRLNEVGKSIAWVIASLLH